MNFESKVDENCASGWAGIFKTPVLTRSSSVSVGTSLKPPNSMMMIMEGITSLTKKVINIEGVTALSISSHDVPQSESACKVIADSAIHCQSAW